jgi:hypothetical protein
VRLPLAPASLSTSLGVVNLGSLPRFPTSHFFFQTPSCAQLLGNEIIKYVRTRAENLDLIDAAALNLNSVLCPKAMEVIKGVTEWRLIK